MKISFDEKAPHWRQSLLKLTRTVEIVTHRQVVCIPSREEAKEEAARLKQEYQSSLAGTKIVKIGKGPKATYTCGYVLRERKTENVF